MFNTRQITSRIAPIFLAITLSTTLATFARTALAITPQEEGLKIAKEVKSRDTGWTDSTANMLMILRNEQGQESLREVSIKTLEQVSEGDKSLTVFNTPRDVRGTAFLSFSHPTGADDQWLYLPVLKRVKRISSKNKSGPFMGSEFSFEDFSSYEVAKYTYTLIGTENVDGVTQFLVEQIPVDENSGYTRRIAWIDEQEFRTQKVEFYDRKGSLLKTLTYDDYKQYLGEYWRSEKMTMINHQSGKSTELQWKNYAFRTGLKDSHFNRNSLKRAR